MILRCGYHDGGESTDVSADPSAAEVAATVRSMDWSRFAFVTLYRDESNWLEGSGCMEPDFGLSMMLRADGIEYVTESAPPDSDAMLALFDAYLHGEHELLYRLIYDAERRGLQPADVEALRQQDEASQREMMRQRASAAAAELFASRNYTGCIEALEPFESQLGPIDVRRLALARRRQEDAAPETND